MNSAQFVRATGATYHNSDVNSARNRRRHAQLAGVVEGHTVLSLDGTADDALRYLQTIMDFTRQTKTFETFSLAGAVTVLERMMKDLSTPPGDPCLFDRYLSIMYQIAWPNVLAPQTAMLKLFHPTSPDPWPTYHRMSEDVELKDSGMLNKTVTIDYMGHLLMRASLLLKLS